ncbi:hypothetical protein [Mycobacterium sp.]|uniref:hypothetical protein n=1 Tax=Mycobacterium sp. TaxID=1785 RepID=UPI002B8371B6|nr:hypothetical protein [Mycobacterium sp.]HTY35402.1 hypothetical protein [Mycobacterium sp.]
MSASDQLTLLLTGALAVLGLIGTALTPTLVDAWLQRRMVVRHTRQRRHLAGVHRSGWRP